MKYRFIVAVAFCLICMFAPAAPAFADAGALPIIHADTFSQFAIVIAAYIIKPIYVLLTFAVVVILWKSKSRDLQMIRNAAIWFFIGEYACTANYVCTGGDSNLLDLVHSFGMVGMNGYLAYGLTLLFDERVTHYIDPAKGCAFQRLCVTCWKREDVSCPFQKLAVLLAPALGIIALMPLFMPLEPFRVVLPVFGTDVVWTKTLFALITEFRVYPLAAVVLFTVAWMRLSRGKQGVAASMPPFFAAVGFMSFSLFRFIMLAPFRFNPIWSDWWEELSELFMVLFVVFLLDALRGPLGLRVPWRRKLA